jgi:glycosyltransferase involved in cell wall biosynthesis
MRVLLIDINYKHSSTGKIVHDLARELILSGHKARVLFGRGEYIDNDVALRIATVWEVYFHALLTRLTGLIGIFSFFSTRKIIKEIKKFKPDVIHLHELHGYYVNCSEVVRFLKTIDVPVIWTFHCEFAYTGKCGHAYDCEKWKTECSACPQIKEYPSSLYFDFTRYMFHEKKKDFERFDNLTIVTPSAWLARRVKQSFLSGYAVRVIHNGIDTQDIFFPRTNGSKQKSKMTVLAVAPDIMSERKGGKWVMKLARRFSEDVEFVMVGVVGTVDEVPSNVRLVGRTSNQHELARYYSDADIFLICSKRENFPTTCLEALSCGTPVMGFDEGGTAETAPGRLGYFVPFGDIDSLEIALMEYFSGNSKIDQKECHLFAKKNYSIQTMCSNYLRLYSELVNKGMLDE